MNSVFGNFSSVVSICPKKLLSQIWGPLFTRGTPVWVTGALPPTLFLPMHSDAQISEK